MVIQLLKWRVLELFDILEKRAAIGRDKWHHGKNNHCHDEDDGEDHHRAIEILSVSKHRE